MNLCASVLGNLLLLALAGIQNGLQLPVVFLLLFLNSGSQVIHGGVIVGHHLVLLLLGEVGVDRCNVLLLLLSKLSFVQKQVVGKTSVGLHVRVRNLVFFLLAIVVLAGSLARLAHKAVIIFGVREFLRDERIARVLILLGEVLSVLHGLELGLFLLQTLLHLHAFEDLLETTSVSESQVREHGADLGADESNILVTLDFLQVSHDGIFVLEHLVHVVAALVLSLLLVLGDLLLDLIESALHQLVHISKVFDFIELVLLLLEVFLKGLRCFITLHAASMFTGFDTLLDEVIEVAKHEGEQDEEGWDVIQPWLKLTHGRHGLRDTESLQVVSCQRPLSDSLTDSFFVVGDVDESLHNVGRLVVSKDKGSRVLEVDDEGGDG